MKSYMGYKVNEILHAKLVIKSLQALLLYYSEGMLHGFVIVYPNMHIPILFHIRFLDTFSSGPTRSRYLTIIWFYKQYYPFTTNKCIVYSTVHKCHTILLFSFVTLRFFSSFLLTYYSSYIPSNMYILSFNLYNQNFKFLWNSLLFH